MFVRILCILWLCLAFLFAQAQEPFFITHSIKNGLPANEVYNIWQDKRGYIWLTSDEGLHRYDGFSYKPYRSAGQSFIAGASIQEDDLGRIWYETFDGWLYYTDGDSLKQFKQNRPIDFIPFHIYKGKLFVIQIEGLDIYDTKTLKLLHTIPVNTYRVQYTACNQNGFYFAANNTLYHISPNYSVSSVALPVTNNNLALITTFPDSIHVVTGSTNNYIIRVFDNNLRYLHSYPYPIPGSIRALSVVNNQSWYCTTQGLFPHPTASQPYIANNAGIFRGKSISSAFRDRNGNYWIASTDGILLVPDINNKLYTIPGETITRIASWQNQIVAGTRNGNLLLFDTHTKEIKYIINTPSDHEIYFLHVQNNIVAYTGKKFGLISLTNKFSMLENLMATKAVCYIDGKYLGIARSGACGLQLISGCENIKSAWDNIFYNKSTVVINTYTRDLTTRIRARATYYHAAEKLLLFGTSIGLLKFDTTGRYETITMNGQPFYARDIIGIGKEVFLLSARGGLYVWKDNKISEIGNVTNGQNIRKALKHNQSLCLIAENDVYIYNPATKTNTRLQANVPAGSIKDIAWVNDTMWVATEAGIFSVTHPTYQPANDHPPFYINKILVNNIELYPQNKEYVFDYKNNNISINYSILSFATNTPIPAYYKMTDDGNWKPLPDNSRTLNFQSLAPGRYHISFRLDNHVQNQQVIFTIKAPFWREWWFFTLCTVIILLLAGTIYTRRMRDRVNKLEAQKEKIQLQEDRSRSMLAAIRAQMNPHFFFNALNTIQAYIVTNNKEKASNYLAKFSMLTRTILEMTEAETISLPIEINALQLYLELEKMRFPSGFEYTINTYSLISPDSIEIPSMIIQPFVENAVKHGLLHKEGEKKLSVTIYTQNNALMVEVDDNGIGRSRSEELNKIKQKKHQSFSTRATEQRLAILNSGRTQKITVTIIDKLNERKQPSGTTVMIKIPLENV